MSLQAVGVMTLLLGALALLRGPAFGISVLVPLTLLGAAGAVLLGGAGTIQPAHLMLGLLAASAVGRLDWTPARRCLAFPQAGFWLAGFTVWGLASAVFIPRLLSRITDINAIGSTEFGPSVLLVPLGPTSGNLTQSIYIAADCLCFLIASAFSGRPEGFRLLARAMAGYCALNIGFALLDLGTFWTNSAWLFDPVRNADYQLHTETIATGLKRIVGSFTETAAFSYATLGTFGYTAELCLSGVRPRLFGAMAIASALLLLLSTSTTAYAGTPLLLALLYGLALRRVVRPAAASTHAFLMFLPIVCTLLGTGILLNPKIFAAVSDTLATMVFDKAASQSGLERAQWNATAWQNALDSRGIGVGLGSVRASSFPLALVANTGVPGCLLLAGFLVRTFFRADAAAEPIMAVRRAARMACAGLLIGASVSGAMVDLGLAFFLFAALACARPLPVAQPAFAGQSDTATLPLRRLAPRRRFLGPRGIVQA